jgi:hypothetical protein
LASCHQPASFVCSSTALLTFTTTVNERGNQFLDLLS